jgi:dTDP-4-amino-4,6-dideoxygalactose transaminase
MSYFRKRYGYRAGDFPISEQIGNSTISLPFYPDMPLNDVDVVVEAAARFLGRSHQQQGLVGRERRA